MKYSLLLACLLAAPALTYAQTYEEILAAHPGAAEMLVAFDGVLAFERPHPGTRVITRFNRDEIVLAYEKLGPYYKVAIPDMGHVGYVRVTELAEPGPPPVLSAAARPAGSQAAPVPERGSGAARTASDPPTLLGDTQLKVRVDLFGGVAYPLAPEAFRDAYHLGYHAAGGLIIPVREHVAFAFRASYSQYALDPEQLLKGTPYLPKDIEIEGAEATMLGLHTGLRLSPEPDGRVHGYGLLLAGIHRVGNKEGAVRVFRTREEFDAYTETRFSGLAGLGLGVELVRGLGFFIEANYVVVATDGTWLSFVPISVGLSATSQ